MLVNIPYHTSQIGIQVPENALVYRSAYQDPGRDPGELVLGAVNNPIDSPPLPELIQQSGARSLVLVVSDITRPIPYASFLPALLEEIERAALPRENITILIATGMHRPSTAAEREYMFGREVCQRYQIQDHQAHKAAELVRINGTSQAGNPIELNRAYLEADFRIVTGLVEPHFMAGFSGGRKAICPGLCSLKTVKAFHGYKFLDNPSARNGNLDGNPLHLEALSIARQARVDFCINLVLDQEGRLVSAIAGSLEGSHDKACGLVREQACPPVEEEADLVLTSSGGYPLDATFYQCVKGLVSCLPAVRKGGIIISIGSCSEGIGGSEYQRLMHKYSVSWREYLNHIRGTDRITKDQWQFQMQTRALKHVGDGNLVFITSGLSASNLKGLSVNGISAPEDCLQETIQTLLDGYLDQGRSLAVIPEGPYCAPIGSGGSD